MSEIESMQALGPAGVTARMHEIRSRMNDVLGINPWQATLNTAMNSGGNQGGPSPLQGAVGGSSTSPYGSLDPASPFSPNLSVGSSAPGELRSQIESAASAHGLDADLLDAVVKQESNYSLTARSGAGALGLTQLMPQTAQDMGVSNPFDAAQNLNGGARYLRQQVDRFGDLKLALAAYNAGPHAVIKHGGVPPYRETQAYVQNVLGHYQRSKGLNAEGVKRG